MYCISASSFSVILGMGRSFILGASSYKTSPHGHLGSFCHLHHCQNFFGPDDLGHCVTCWHLHPRSAQVDLVRKFGVLTTFSPSPCPTSRFRDQEGPNGLYTFHGRRIAVRDRIQQLDPDPTLPLHHPSLRTILLLRAQTGWENMFQATVGRCSGTGNN
jgi:hypothetical protein